jgi:hypothetical protein
MPDLPRSILPYLEIALGGPLEAGVLAHRAGRVTIDLAESTGDVGLDGRHQPKRRIFVAACDLDQLGKNAPERQTMSASFADGHGAQACTADACFPGAETDDHLPVKR